MTVFRGPPGRPSALVAWWRRRPPLGFAAKVSIAIALGLSFVITWTTLSPTSSSQQISTERTYFATDIADPPPASHSDSTSGRHRKPHPTSSHNHKKRHSPSRSHRHPNATASPDATAAKANRTEPASRPDKEPEQKELETGTEPEEEEEEQEKEVELSVPEDNGDNAGKAPEEGDEKPPELELVDESSELDGDDEEAEAAKRKASKKKKKLPPLFSPAAHYHWKHCSAKNGHHYIPCVDFEGDGSQRHHERSCPRSPVTCLVSLPKEYKPPVPWPERKEKVTSGA